MEKIDSDPECSAYYYIWYQDPPESAAVESSNIVILTEGVVQSHARHKNEHVHPAAAKILIEYPGQFKRQAAAFFIEPDMKQGKMKKQHRQNGDAV